MRLRPLNKLLGYTLKEYVTLIYSAIKYVSLAALLVFSSSSFSETETCIDKLYKFGTTLDFNYLGENATKEITTTPNKWGQKGELIYLETISFNGSWLKTKECNSCNPKKMATEIYLKPSGTFLCGLKHGASIKEVVSALGEPKKSYGENLIYYYPKGDLIQHISMNMKDNKLQAIYWLFYLR
jgi:hypothetical protein